MAVLRANVHQARVILDATLAHAAKSSTADKPMEPSAPPRCNLSHCSSVNFV
jgi:hypothetical protein